MGRSRHTRGLSRETPVKEQEEGKQESRGRVSELDASLMFVRAGKDGEEARGREAPTAGQPGDLFGQVCGAPGHEGWLEASQEGQTWSGSGTLCARLSAGSSPGAQASVEAGWTPWCSPAAASSPRLSLEQSPLERGWLPAPGCLGPPCPRQHVHSCVQEKHLHGARGPLLRRRPGRQVSMRKRSLHCTLGLRAVMGVHHLPCVSRPKFSPSQLSPLQVLEL